jgi:PAS domain S-box-containing protein
MYISLISGILNILIGGYVFYLNPKRITNRIFSILVLFFAIFCVGEFIAKSTGTEELALVGGRICYSIFILAGYLSVHFSIVFPRKYSNDVNPFSRHKYLLLSLYILSIILVIVFNLLVSIKDVKIDRWGHSVVLSDSTLFVLFWFIFCTICVTASLIHTYFRKNITGNEKKQLEFLTIGFIVLATFSLGTNLIPPVFGMHVFPMTSVSLVLFSIIITYSMIKYQLMQLTTAETADIVVDTMSDSLVVVDDKELIVNLNKSTLNLLGYRRNELIDSSLDKIVKFKELNQKRNRKIFESNLFNDLTTNRSIKDTEVNFIDKQGNSIPMNVSASLIYDWHKSPVGVVIVARDLTETKKLINALEEAKNKLEDKVKERTKELTKTNKELQTEIKEREKAEEKIKISLEEKELLLKEIHHRVKNNLQIVSSLLDLQSGYLKSKEDLKFIRESQNRIKSMSLIHEQLYQSKDLANINFEEYIRNLIASLLRSYAVSLDNVSFKINVKDVALDINKAIPCGLIISELVTNSLKHGFPDGKKGEINVDFHLNENNDYSLIISDNGVGIPKDFTLQTTKSLGLRLVNMLIQQLKGTIELDRDQGTKIEIRFPKSKK